MKRICPADVPVWNIADGCPLIEISVLPWVMENGSERVPVARNTTAGSSVTSVVSGTNARLTDPDAEDEAALGSRMVNRRCCALWMGPESNSSSGVGSGALKAVPVSTYVRVPIARAPVYTPAELGVKLITNAVVPPGRDGERRRGSGDI